MSTMYRRKEHRAIQQKIHENKQSSDEGVGHCPLFRRLTHKCCVGSCPNRGMDSTCDKLRTLGYLIAVAIALLLAAWLWTSEMSGVIV